MLVRRIKASTDDLSGFWSSKAVEVAKASASTLGRQRQSPSSGFHRRSAWIQRMFCEMPLGSSISRPWFSDTSVARLLYVHGNWLQLNGVDFSRIHARPRYIISIIDNRVWHWRMFGGCVKCARRAVERSDNDRQSSFKSDNPTFDTTLKPGPHQQQCRSNVRRCRSKQH